MKNLICHKNGFTLIELLATILILAAILLFVIPAGIKYLNSSKTNLTSVQNSNIEDGVKLYYQDCNNRINADSSSDECIEFSEFLDQDDKKTTYCVTLSKLVDLNYIEPIKVDGKDYFAEVKMYVYFKGNQSDTNNIKYKVTEADKATDVCNGMG